MMASTKTILSLAVLANLALADNTIPRVCSENTTFSLSDISYGQGHRYNAPSKLAYASAGVSFTVTNTAGEYDLECSATSKKVGAYFDGKTAFTCGDDDLYAPFKANFTFERPSNTIAITAKWGCYNRKTRNYDTFEGKASGSAQIKCNDRAWDNKNWTEGALFSYQSTSCDPVELTLIPTAKLIESKSLAPKRPAAPPAPAGPAVPAKAPAPVPPKGSAPVAPTPPKGAAPYYLPWWAYDDDDAPSWPYPIYPVPPKGSRPKAPVAPPKAPVAPPKAPVARQRLQLLRQRPRLPQGLRFRQAHQGLRPLGIARAGDGTAMMMMRRIRLRPQPPQLLQHQRPLLLPHPLLPLPRQRLQLPPLPPLLLPRPSLLPRPPRQRLRPRAPRPPRQHRHQLLRLMRRTPMMRGSVKCIASKIEAVWSRDVSEIE